MKTNLVVLSMARGPHDMEAHAQGCRDIARKSRLGVVNNSWPVVVDLSGDVERQLDEDVNDDFASDLGMTVEDYLDEGNGYRTHVHPCCRGAR